MNYITALLLLLPVFAQAQFSVVQSNHIPVTRSNNSEIRNPWTGGINAAELSMFDADLDGDEDDIFIFDKSGDRILIFIGSMEGGERVYTHEPRLSANFPDLSSWALLRDFDCDGRRDIFTYSPLGGAVAVYRNTSTEINGISFELETESLLSYYEFTGSQFTTNIYVSSQDIPAIFDFEGDGDLDFLIFSVGGGFVELHLNNSMENDGTCGINDVALRNRCYGRFIEGSENNGIIQDPELVNQACSFNVVNPKSNGDRPRSGSAKGAKHIGSTILAFDANQDGLPEIILGDVSYTNMTYLENNDRGDQLDSIGYVSTSFPSDFGASAVHIDNFPAGFYEDLDGDGTKDLIVSVNNPYGSDNKESVWYYENLGESDLPIFNLVQRNFLQDQTIEFGEATAPAVFDYNNDGLDDLVIGARGEFLGSGFFKPTLSLYENTGTASSPAFKLIDEDWLTVSDLGIGQFAYPTFADMDNDGDTDMMVGESSGEVHYFENTAGSNENADFSLIGLVMTGGSPIDVGQSSTPALYDINDDGLFDLIIGERNGNLNYYENTGTANAYTFELVSELLGGITGIENGFFVGNTNASFFTYNDALHVAIGLESGRIQTYTNITGNLSGDFDLVDGAAFGIDEGLRSKPLIHDFNNDDQLDIMCGLSGGGLTLYSGGLTIGLGPDVRNNDLVRVFPNPAQNTLTIARVDNKPLDNPQFNIYSISGALAQSGQLIGANISIQDLPSGMYILEVKTDMGSLHGKFVKK